jgi:hypothetical protein
VYLSHAISSQPKMVKGWIASENPE